MSKKYELLPSRGVSTLQVCRNIRKLVTGRAFSLLQHTSRNLNTLLERGGKDPTFISYHLVSFYSSPLVFYKEGPRFGQVKSVCASIRSACAFERERERRDSHQPITKWLMMNVQHRVVSCFESIILFDIIKRHASKNGVSP